jgi:hypothetical protein
MNSGIGVSFKPTREFNQLQFFANYQANYAYKVRISDDWDFRPVEVGFGFLNLVFRTCC